MFFFIIFTLLKLPLHLHVNGWINFLFLKYWPADWTAFDKFPWLFFLIKGIARTAKNTGSHSWPHWKKNGLRILFTQIISFKRRHKYNYNVFFFFEIFCLFNSLKLYDMPRVTSLEVVALAANSENHLSWESIKAISLFLNRMALFWIVFPTVYSHGRFMQATIIYFFWSTTAYRCSYMQYIFEILKNNT